MVFHQILLHYGPKGDSRYSRCFESNSWEQTSPESQRLNSLAAKMCNLFSRIGLSSELPSVSRVSHICFTLGMLLSIGPPSEETHSKTATSDIRSSNPGYSGTPDSTTMGIGFCLGGPLASHLRQNTLEHICLTKRSLLFIYLYCQFLASQLQIRGPLCRYSGYLKLC